MPNVSEWLRLAASSMKSTIKAHAWPEMAHEQTGPISHDASRGKRRSIPSPCMHEMH